MVLIYLGDLLWYSTPSFYASSPNIGMQAGTVILGAGEGSLVVEMDEFYIHKSRLVRHSAKLGYLLL